MHPAVIAPAGVNPYALIGYRDQQRFSAFDQAEAAGRDAAFIYAALVDERRPDPDRGAARLRPHRHPRSHRRGDRRRPVRITHRSASAASSAPTPTPAATGSRSCSPAGILPKTA